MPRGFDTPSGSSLNEKQKQLAFKVLDYLKRRRIDGARTIEHPAPAHEICDIFNKLGWVMSDVVLRSLVNFLRQEGHPIASGQGGYFYAMHQAELKSTTKHLSDRISGIQKALNGLDTCFGGQKELI